MSGEIIQTVEKEPQTPSRRRHRLWGMEDARRWAEKYKKRTSILKIAREEGADPGTVSAWLKKVGVEVEQGSHFVRQPPLQIPESLIHVLSLGPHEVIKLVKEGIWEVHFTDVGQMQLEKFYRFLELYKLSVGVKETAEELGVQRSTILNWRRGNDIPYVVKLAKVSIENEPRKGWKLLPLTLGAGGNLVDNWMSVPVSIDGFDDLQLVLGQLTPLEDAFSRGQMFGLSRERINSMSSELFGYLLGVMVGDIANEGGLSKRFASSNLDFQVTKKHESNERFGEFVCMCVNMLGVAMSRYKDKQPTGATLKAKDPSAAYRWVSARSPLLAWIFNVCLGLRWDESTSLDSVRMEWLLKTPFEFRKRFIQGLADSDGCVDRYLVRIVSVPNSALVVRLLSSLGMKTQRVIFEKGQQLRTSVTTREGAKLPIFNELVRSYRYNALMSFGVGSV